VKNHFASTVTEYPLCWFACISYLTHPKKGKGGENEKTRLHLAKDCFFHFYGYQNLPEEEKDLKLKHYKGFVLATEIVMLMSLNLMINKSATLNNIPTFVPHQIGLFTH
jgi:hypothetical protein